MTWKKYCDLCPTQMEDAGTRPGQPPQRHEVQFEIIKYSQDPVDEGASRKRDLMDVCFDCINKLIMAVTDERTRAIMEPDPDFDEDTAAETVQEQPTAPLTQTITRAATQPARVEMGYFNVGDNAGNTS